MRTTLKKQQGAETLEFMVVFLMFMILIITVWDFSRALYVWNALAESTRRGARMAVVCPNDATSKTIIRNVAAFDTINGTLGTSPVVKGLTAAAFDITYYDASGDPTDDIKEIQFAEVKINSNYQFQFVIPGIQHLPFDVPEFRTVLYAESKGARPYYPGETKPDPAISCNF